MSLNPSTQGEAPWWRGAVIYQVYPRSFLDSNGDGVGDLPGITQKLDYIADLGVDGIWVSPFFRSPMADFGYDVSDYRSVDPLFGSLSDFDRLLAGAHDRGLKVIIDQVYSHTSIQHAWFAESRSDKTNPKADWYVWADANADGTAPTNWMSVFSCPAWSWDGRRKQYYLHNFLPEQPDLNLHNPEVQQALIDVARFWIDRGVDGFRLDAINYGMHDPQLRDNVAAPRDGRTFPTAFSMQDGTYTASHPDMLRFLEKLRSSFDSRGDVFTVAEIGGWEPTPTMKDYTRGNTRLSSAYGFEFLGLGAIQPADVLRILSGWPGERDEGWPSWAFSNHDAPRVASRWSTTAAPDRAARFFALLQLCLRGNVFIYQGEELGLPQSDVPYERLQDPEAIRNWPDNLGRDGARTPMPWQAREEHLGFSTAEPWLPVEEQHRALSVDQQEGVPGSLLTLFRKLIAVRKSSPALRLGELEIIECTESLLVFLRRHGEERVLCAFNFSNRETASAVQHLTVSSVLASVGLTQAATAPDSLPPVSAYLGLVS